ncbi:MAG: YgiQ family radical SAM protein [Schwartzia sp.]|nr:YgiQ family radical SAM protein [Schwartzia sp. (in: firmicutes)]
MNAFLPMTKQDMAERGWDTLDFIFVSGDAYVDHPSFGPAILCRLLEKHGYRIGIIAQPDWRGREDFCQLGRPRLAFLVSGGNMDSLLNKFTAAKKKRREDAYSPGGRTDCRPERAVTVYSNRLREIWPGVPVVIGGIEASLRRFAHYDYWTDSVRRSVLMDSGADLLVYGMGERQVLEIAAELHRGVSISAIQDVRGTCYRVPDFDCVYDYLPLPSFDESKENKKAFAEAFKLEYLEQDAIRGKKLVQQNGEACVVQNPPALPLSEEEMDEIYDLPYLRMYHPRYESEGGVPALSEVQFSIVSHRGCFGGCHFCAIVSHQGRIIQRRSHASILREAAILTKLPGFKGYIHDVGGPTANFRRPSCDGQLARGTCRGKECLSPKPCRSLIADHSDYLELLKELRAVPGVKKVFIRSGIRFDYLLLAKDDFLETVCRHHLSGQMKIAPEHISDRVTRLMGKSERNVYLRFAERFRKINMRLGKKQYLVPYFMSSHPGATIEDAVELAEFIRDLGYRPEQVQDFIPTPGTFSTAMYYSGFHPLTGEAVYTAKTPKEKRYQRALMQYWLPENRLAAREALRLAHREDLIGYGKQCLVHPATGVGTNRSRKDGRESVQKSGHKKASALPRGRRRIKMRNEGAGK